MDMKLEQTNEQQERSGFGRRDLLKMTGAGAAAAGARTANSTTYLGSNKGSYPLKTLSMKPMTYRGAS